MLSSTFEGIDAASSSLMGRARPQAAQRSRLPRAIGGDRKLLPFKRPPDFSERQVPPFSNVNPCTCCILSSFRL